MSGASNIVPAGWKLAPLSSLAKVVSGGTPARDVSSYWGDGVPWVTPTDITQTNGRYLFDTHDRITKLGVSSSAATLLPPGTILMTLRATVGESRIAGTEVCTNQGFKSLVPLKGVNGLFLYYQMQRLRSAYKVFGIGSTFLEVNKRDTEQFNVLVPKDEDEQRAIAEIIDSIDEAIEKTIRLVSGLGQRVMLLRPESNTDPEFLLWIMNTYDFYRRVVSGLGATTSPHVNVGDIRKQLVARPSPTEQYLIGCALKAQHSALLLEEKYRYKLQQSKHGLMHDLLSGHVRVSELLNVAASI